MKLNLKHLPYFILAILSSGDNLIIASIPVTAEHDSIMSFPLNLLLSGLDRLHMDHLIRAEEPDRSCRNPTPSQSSKRRHPRIIPSGYITALNQGIQLSLAGDSPL